MIKMNSIYHKISLRAGSPRGRAENWVRESLHASYTILLPALIVLHQRPVKN